MNLYLDTSALVKLYVDEPGSTEVADLLARATVVATSRVAYPEARAALARRAREGALARTALRRVISNLDRDFPSYVVIELLEPLARRAGMLAEQRALRGFDAIHLASAIEFGVLAGGPLVFVAYDQRLAAAAAAEGLLLPN